MGGEYHQGSLRNLIHIFHGNGAEKVGITSGASTPEVLVESVIERLAPDNVTMVSGVEEDISFNLPEQLR